MSILIYPNQPDTVNIFSVLKKKGIIIIIVFLIFYVAFAIYGDLNKFLYEIQKIDPFFIILIIMMTSASLIIKSIRQFFLLQQINIKISFKDNIIIYLAGLTMVITPGGLGETIKSYFLKKKYDFPVAKTIPIVLAERYYDFIAVFSIFLIFSIIGGIEQFLILILVLSIVLTIFTIIIKNINLLEKVQKKLSKVKLFNFIENSSPEFNNSILYLSNKKSMIGGGALSFVAWIIDGLALFFVFQAFDQNFDFLSVVVMGFASLLFGVITMIPGGVGVTEVSLVQMLVSSGTDLALATTITIFWRITTIWYVTCIGFIATKFALK